jgi:uncharacterized protein
MSTMTGVRCSVADLLRRPGSSRQVSLAEPLPGLATAAARVAPEVPVAFDLTLSRVPEGIVVRGTLRATFAADCSRCVRPVRGELTVHVDELFEPDPLEGETYPLDGEHVDLEPIARDALLPALPSTPLCRADCAGLCPTCGADRNEFTCACTDDVADERWAPLRALQPEES